MKIKIQNFLKENPHSFALLYFVIYVFWFFGLEFFAKPKYWLYSPLDDLIPFCEYFIVPYFLWFPYFLGALGYFLFKDRNLFIKLCLVMFGGMTISLIIYTFFPNAIDLRAEIVRDNIFCKFAGLLRSVDTPTNVCPSIHCSSTLAVHWAVTKYQNFKFPKLTKFISSILTISICLSTVFLKQHSVIDVFYGLLLTVVLIIFLNIYQRSTRFMPQFLRGYLKS